MDMQSLSIDISNMINLKNSCYIDDQKIFHMGKIAVSEFSAACRLYPLRNKNKESIKRYSCCSNKHKTLSSHFKYNSSAIKISNNLINRIIPSKLKYYYNSAMNYHNMYGLEMNQYFI